MCVPLQDPLHSRVLHLNAVVNQQLEAGAPPSSSPSADAGHGERGLAFGELATEAISNDVLPVFPMCSQ